MAASMAAAISSTTAIAASAVGPTAAALLEATIATAPLEAAAAPVEAVTAPLEAAVPATVHASLGHFSTTPTGAKRLPQKRIRFIGFPLSSAFLLVFFCISKLLMPSEF
jgi:hypothetical protein